MILVVSGWRDWTDATFAVRHLRPYLAQYQFRIHVRVGCAAGLDKVMRDFLDACDLPFTVYRAQWNEYGKAAGMIRNGYMLRGEHNPRDQYPNVQADKLLAFPQPGINWKTDKSGTVGCILDAVSLGIGLDVPGYRKRREDETYLRPSLPGLDFETGAGS